MKNNFIQSSLIYFLGTVLLRGISFLTLPIYTRIMLPEEYGLYSLFTASLSIVTIFVGFQIQGSVNLTYNTKSEEEFDTYVANISLFPLLILIISLLLLLIVPQLTITLRVPSVLFSIMMFIQAYFGVVINIYMSELIIKKRPKKHLVVSIITTILNVVLSVSFVLMFTDHSYFAMVIAGVIANLIIVIYIFFKYIFRIQLSSLKEDWKYGLRLSLPLIFHVLSHQVLNVADRFMLEKYQTEIQVAIYSVVYSIGAIIQMIWSAINNAWIPWYFENLKESSHKMIRLYSKQYIIFFSIGTVLFLLISPEITLILGGKQYYSGVNSVPLIILAYFFVFLYSFYVNYEFAKEKTILIPLATILAAIINIILNIYFIPRYGYLGASLTTAISYFLMLMFHYFVVVNVMKHRDFPDYYTWLSIVAILIGMSITYVFLDEVIIRVLIFIMIMLGYGGYVFYLLKKSNIIKNFKYDK